MFEKYIDEQPIATKMLINAINNKKLSHAYIFETNDYQKAYELILDFIKYIACPHAIESEHIEKECNICSAINSGNYIELKIINSETLQIKKEEMLALQQEFKSKAIEGKQKIYLIKCAEKLNPSSANTILKFLEEPEDNIIAILMTPSRFMLINTILSRCQIVSLKNVDESVNIVTYTYNEYYASEEYNEETIKKIDGRISNVVSFAEYNEINGLNTLMFINDQFFKNFKTREDILSAFEITKMLYYDIMKYMLNNKCRYFAKYDEIIKHIAKLNDIDSITKKLMIISNTIEKIKYNVNLNLLLDKYVMEMGGNFDD